jgi:hypothetical protein
MAIGQLADYRRFVDDQVSCKLLLPGQPAADLVDLFTDEGIAIIVPEGNGFREIP